MVIYLSKVRLILGFVLVSCTTKMKINEVRCFKKWMWGWKFSRNGWRMEAQVRSQTSPWGCGSSLKDVDCYYCCQSGLKGSHKVVRRLVRGTKQRPNCNLTKCRSDLTPRQRWQQNRLCVKSSVKHFNLFFTSISDIALWIEASKRRTPKDRDESVQVKTSDYFLNLRTGTNSYHNSLSSREWRQRHS